MFKLNLAILNTKNKMKLMSFPNKKLYNEVRYLLILKEFFKADIEIENL